MRIRLKGVQYKYKGKWCKVPISQASFSTTRPEGLRSSRNIVFDIVQHASLAPQLFSMDDLMKYRNRKIRKSSK